jgi:hypothetical protein
VHLTLHGVSLLADRLQAAILELTADQP